MVLCEAAALLGDNFFVTWGLLTVLGFLSIFVFSGSVFGCYYWKPTFEQWQRKLHPDFPSPKMVRNEILQTFKGLVTATVCPALSLYLASHDVRLFGVAIKSQAFCGVEPHGWNSILASFAWIWVITDFYEWGYHFLGEDGRRVVALIPSSSGTHLGRDDSRGRGHSIAEVHRGEVYQVRILQRGQSLRPSHSPIFTPPLHASATSFHYLGHSYRGALPGRRAWPSFVV